MQRYRVRYGVGVVAGCPPSDVDMSFWPLTLCLLLAVYTCLTTDVEDCGSMGTVSSVTVSECDNPPCHFIRGSNVSLSIDFQSDEEITQMLVLPTVNVGGLAIAVPGISEDGCADLSHGQCPAAPRERIVYSTDIEVLKDYPQIDGEVKWEILDQNNATVICLSVNATIHD